MTQKQRKRRGRRKPVRYTNSYRFLNVKSDPIKVGCRYRLKPGKEKYNNSKEVEVTEILYGNYPEGYAYKCDVIGMYDRRVYPETFTPAQAKDFYWEMILSSPDDWDISEVVETEGVLI